MLLGICLRPMSMRSLITISAMAGFAATQAWAENWSSHGGDERASKYSPLTQINRDNVKDLELAWSYRTGDGEGPILEVGSYGLGATPVMVPPEAGGALVFCSAFDRVVALAVQAACQPRTPRLRSHPFGRCPHRTFL